MDTRIIAGALVVSLAALSAQAQTTSMRTFVSGLGTDAGTCQRAVPCRSFQYAYGMTRAGGEVVALDPGGYGTLTINHAISIIGPPGGGAAITVPSGGTGIAINASSSDAVILRGLEVDGNGQGAYGINAQSGGSLTVADSVVTGVGNTGIFIGTTTGTITGSLVAVIGNVTNISVNSSGSTVLSSDVILGGGNGISSSTAGGRIVVDNCVVSGATNNGFSLSNNVVGFVKRSLITNITTNGLAATFGATVYLDTTTITPSANTAVLIFQGGTVNSYGNNNIVGTVNGGKITTVTPN